MSIIFTGNISKNFTQKEYCGGAKSATYSASTATFVRCLQQFRKWLGKPMYVVSWWRSKATNVAVGGIPNSNHLTDTACDWRLNGKAIDKATFIAYAKKWNEITRSMGCVGEAGLYNTWVHWGMQSPSQAKANGHKFVHWDSRSGKQINNPFPELRGL